MLANKNSKKLIPLRVIARENGTYSKEYLSQLVHRRKLKAKRIGRNYFTCWQWFNEYLNTHASEEIRARIKSGDNSPEVQAAHSEKESGFLLPILSSTMASQATASEPKIKNSFIFKLLYLKYILSAVLAGLVILFLFNIYVDKTAITSDNGRVAGTSETGTIKKSKGELEDDFIMHDNSLYRVSESVSTAEKKVYMMEEVKHNK